MNCWRFNYSYFHFYIWYALYKYILTVSSTIYIFKDFIDRKRESKNGRGEGQRGRGRSKFPTEQGARCRSWSLDSQIMTWAEGRLCHIGIPHLQYILVKVEMWDLKFYLEAINYLHQHILWNNFSSWVIMLFKLGLKSSCKF